MQIYKDLNSPKTKEFEKLLNSQSSKSKIEEGKIIDCKVAKITEKYIFVDYPGLKSEAVIDINEYKSINKNTENLKIGDKISVLLEKLEDRNGEILVSAVKAFKILGWNKLVKKFENNEGTIIELGGVKHRYHCPLSRTVYVGKPDPEISDTLKVTNEGIEKALQKTKPNRDRKSTRLNSSH